MKKDRINRVLQEMEKEKLPQILLSDSAAVFYLIGKWIHPMERMMVLYLNTKGVCKLFVNDLFPVQAEPGLEIVHYNDMQSPIALLAQYLNKGGTIGVDKNWPSKFLIELMELGVGDKFVNCSSLVDKVRMIKDEEEISRMREASRINDMAVERLEHLVSATITEKQMANALAGIYEDLDVSEGFSFDPIIAFGVNTSDPHHATDSDLFLKLGDAVTLDIGCIKNSYCSDMTRTVFFGEPSAKQKKIYDIVLEANRRGISAVKPGNRFCDVDNAARDYITSKGYGECFLHRTGHSIGLECHEFGDVSAINTDILVPGMTFSVEPGVYIADEFGVRIEDLVLVTENGCEVLNHNNKELSIIK